MATKILCIAGPTASGKSSRAVAEALARGRLPAGRQGEIISVDSRQVYRGLDIGTEKITPEEMRGVPHHLIDIRDAGDTYSAGDFVADAARLIREISARGKLPILVGGTHFYFDALLTGLPREVGADSRLREELERATTEELYARVSSADMRRAAELDPKNRRRLIRALEIIVALGAVPPREQTYPQSSTVVDTSGYRVEWIVIDPPREELRARIDERLANALERGLLEEVRRVREQVGDTRLNELGLEYRIVGEFLRLPALPTGQAGGRQVESPEASLLSALSAKLWHYARRQKAWLRKLGHAVS